MESTVSRPSTRGISLVSGTESTSVMHVSVGGLSPNAPAFVPTSASGDDNVTTDALPAAAAGQEVMETVACLTLKYGVNY